MAILISYLQGHPSSLSGTSPAASSSSSSSSSFPSPSMSQPPHNSALLVDRHGNFLYNYQKVHTVTVDPLEALTQGGRSFSTAVLNTSRGQNIRVGSFICFDREHPEAARLLALQQAEVLLIPTACNVPRGMLLELQTRAVDNGVGVAMANYARSQQDSDPMNGHSAAYDYAGTPLVEAGEEEGLFLATFDVGRQRRDRQRRRRVANQHKAKQQQYPEFCALHKSRPFRPEPLLAGIRTFLFLSIFFSLLCKTTTTM